MALAGKVVLVTGGSGTIGGGVARRALVEGARVIAPSRTEAAKAKLLANVQGGPLAALDSPIFDVGTQEGALKLASFVKEQGLSGKLDHVVFVVGGMVPPGFASDITSASLLEAVKNKLEPLVFLNKELLPLVSKSPASSYSVVTGLLGECVVAEQKAKGAGAGPRINELRLGAAIPAQFPTDAFAVLVQQVMTGTQVDSVVRVTPAELTAGKL